MAGNIKEDLKQIKLFKDSYKKCKVISSKDAKEAEEYAKKVKYFGYDMRQGLEALEEMVAEKKTDPEVIKGKKIEDYEVYRDIKAMLKDVKYNLKKVVDAAKSLERLEKDADIEACKKKLNHLLKTIQLDTKLRKGGKPEKIVANLQKQVEEDLKLMDNFHADIKKALPRYPKLPDYAKEYDREVTNIANIKPRLSSRTKKYVKVAKDWLQPKVLKAKVSECQKAKEDLEDYAEDAISAATNGDDRKYKAVVSDGIQRLREITTINQFYTKISNKYSQEIGKSENEKLITKAITAIDKIWTDADDLWDDVDVKTRKIKKDNAKKG